MVEHGYELVFLDTDRPDPAGGRRGGTTRAAVLAATLCTWTARIARAEIAFWISGRYG